MLLGLLAITLGQAPTVELRLMTNPGTATCPDLATLKANVSIQLGYSPFLPVSEMVYEAAATCMADGCEGSLRISRPSEEAQTRPFLAGPGQCGELFQSMAYRGVVRRAFSNNRLAVAPRRKQTHRCACRHACLLVKVSAPAVSDANRGRHPLETPSVVALAIGRS